MSRSKSSGFTMIELMIAMTLLAIVGTLSFTGFVLQTQKTRDARRKADLKQMKTALSGYFDDSGCYPEDETVTCGGKGMVPYMSSVVCDPTNNTEFKYVYQKESCVGFKIFTKLENKADKSIAENSCGGVCGPGNQFNYQVSSND